MRPLKLEVEGLQSFEDKQIINFERLTSERLFGIFGDTGSGKSTIIDAITYAIYGDIVRIKGSNNSTLFDLLNINSKQLRVKFEFILNEKNYSIERIVKSKRDRSGLGTPKAILERNDEVIGEGSKEIKKIIEDIIGLSMEDFTRSVVLPQGKFSEFLKLENERRRIMLSNIFGLQEYGKRLEIKAKTKRDEILKEFTLIDESIKVLESKANEDLLKDKRSEYKEIKEKVEKVENHYTTIDNKLKDLDKLKILYEEKNRLEVELKVLEDDKSEIEGITRQIERAKKSNFIKVNIENLNKFKKDKMDLLVEVDLVEKKIVKEDEKLKEFNKTKEEVEKELKKLNKVADENSVKVEERRRKETLQGLKSRYDSTNSEKIEVQKEIQGLTYEIGEKSGELKEVEGNINSLNKELLDLVVPKETIVLDIQRRIEDLRLDEVESLEEDIKKNKDKLKKLEKKEKIIQGELENLDIYEEELFEEERKAFASKLALQLKAKGGPCPVCGGLDHPHLAIDSSSDIVELEKKLKKLKNDRSSFQDEIASLGIPELNGRIKGLEESLGARRSEKLKAQSALLKKELDVIQRDIKLKEGIKGDLEGKIQGKIDLKNRLDTDISSLEGRLEVNKGLKTKLDDSIVEILDECKRVDSSTVNDRYLDIDLIDSFIKTIVEKEEKFEEVTDILKIKKEGLEDLNNSIQELGEVLKELNINKIGLNHKNETLFNRIEEEEKLISKFIEDSDFEDMEHIEASMLDESVIEDLSSRVNKYKEKVDEVTISLKNNRVAIGDDIFIIDEYYQLKEEFEKVGIDKNKYISDCGSLENEIKNIKKDLERVADHLKERKKKYAIYEKYATLTNLFSSNKFVEFLAMSKIRGIARSASSRLSKISNGRYALTTSSNGSFLVIDNFNNGETRKSSTLSGGETFLVSLSLALALSSQLQLKGNVNLDFFFLDEGFGTLDNNTLDRVISSLERLKNEEKMIVGIISHVEDLKERIPRKLIVEGPVSGEHGSIVRIQG